MELYFMADCRTILRGIGIKPSTGSERRTIATSHTSDDLVLIALYRNPISQNASRSESHIGPM